MARARQRYISRCVSRARCALSPPACCPGERSCHLPVPDCSRRRRLPPGAGAAAQGGARRAHPPPAAPPKRLGPWVSRGQDAPPTLGRGPDSPPTDIIYMGNWQHRYCTTYIPSLTPQGGPRVGDGSMALFVPGSIIKIKKAQKGAQQREARARSRLRLRRAPSRGHRQTGCARGHKSLARRVPGWRPRRPRGAPPSRRAERPSVAMNDDTVPNNAGAGRPIVKMCAPAPRGRAGARICPSRAACARVRAPERTRSAAGGRWNPLRAPCIADTPARPLHAPRHPPRSRCRRAGARAACASLRSTRRRAAGIPPQHAHAGGFAQTRTTSCTPRWTRRTRSSSSRAASATTRRRWLPRSTACRGA